MTHEEAKDARIAELEGMNKNQTLMLGEKRELIESLQQQVREFRGVLSERDARIAELAALLRQVVEEDDPYAGGLSSTLATRIDAALEMKDGNAN